MSQFKDKVGLYSSLDNNDPKRKKPSMIGLVVKQTIRHLLYTIVKNICGDVNKISNI